MSLCWILWKSEEMCTYSARFETTRRMIWVAWDIFHTQWIFFTIFGNEMHFYWSHRIIVEKKIVIESSFFSETTVKMIVVATLKLKGNRVCYTPRAHVLCVPLYFSTDTSVKRHRKRRLSGVLSINSPRGKSCLINLEALYDVMTGWVDKGEQWMLSPLTSARFLNCLQ